MSLRLPPPFEFTGPLPDWDYEVNRNTDQVRGLIALVIAQTAPNAVLWAPKQTFPLLNAAGTTKFSPYAGISIADANFSSADTSDYTLTTSGTIAAWFHVFAEPGNGEYPSILSRFSYTGEGTNEGWKLGLTASSDGDPKVIECSLFGNNGFTEYRLSTGVQVVAGTTYFCVHTTDTTTRRIYLNGVQKATTTSSPTALSTSAPIVLGGTGTSVDVRLIRGMLYDRALSASEIWQLYQQGTRDELFYPITLHDVPPFVPAGIGGYYLLENGADKYLLEDGSGFYLLEETEDFPAGYIKQFQNPLLRM